MSRSGYCKSEQQQGKLTGDKNKFEWLDQKSSSSRYEFSGNPGKGIGLRHGLVLKRRGQRDTYTVRVEAQLQRARERERETVMSSPVQESESQQEMSICQVSSVSLGQSWKHYMHIILWAFTLLPAWENAPTCNRAFGRLHSAWKHLIFCAYQHRASFRFALMYWKLKQNSKYPVISTVLPIKSLTLTVVSFKINWFIYKLSS